MSVAEFNTLHKICEIERTQLLAILAMSLENPQLACFRLNQNCSKLLYFEGSAACLYDCPRTSIPFIHN